MLKLLCLLTLTPLVTTPSLFAVFEVCRSEISMSLLVNTVLQLSVKSKRNTKSTFPKYRYLSINY